MLLSIIRLFCICHLWRVCECKCSGSLAHVAPQQFLVSCGMRSVLWSERAPPATSPLRYVLAWFMIVKLTGSLGLGWGVPGFPCSKIKEFFFHTLSSFLYILVFMFISIVFRFFHSPVIYVLYFIFNSIYFMFPQTALGCTGPGGEE